MVNPKLVAYWEESQRCRLAKAQLLSLAAYAQKDVLYETNFQLGTLTIVVSFPPIGRKRNNKA
jgi:hypothetical protein